MKMTTLSQIPYPVDEDISAGAMDLEAIATTTDAALVSPWNSLQNYNNLHLGIVSKAGTSSGISAGNLTQVGFDTTEWYDGGVAPASVNSTITGSFANGWYSIGGFLPVSLTGAATTDSYREMQIIIAPLPGTPGGQAVYHTRQYEDGTGSNQLALETVAYLYWGCTMNMFFQHGNTASTMTVQPGARMWAQQITWDVS